MSNTSSFWDKKLEKYSENDWSNRQSLFAEFAIKYFPRNGKLIELGSGVGQDSVFFARNGYDVLCTDFSEFGLRRAQDVAKSEDLNMKYKVVDFSKHLDFLNDAFEIVYSHLSLHFFDSQHTRALFEDIARILKPGGVLACLVNSDLDPEIPKSTKISGSYYETPSGLKKIFFSVKNLKMITLGLFDDIVADNQGRTYKDGENSLVRYIGSKK